MGTGMKEIHRLMRTIGKISDKQATITNVNWDGDVREFTISIRPNGGPYKNGQFDFKVILDIIKPDDPPLVWCLTEIYHPNIDTTEEFCEEEPGTNVCLNLLEHHVWVPKLGLEGLVLGLLFLMHHPNLDDPLSPHFDGTVEWERFQSNVDKYMAGKPLDDDTTFNTKFRVYNGVRANDIAMEEKVITIVVTEDTNETVDNCQDDKSTEDNKAKLDDAKTVDNDDQIVVEIENTTEQSEIENTTEQSDADEIAKAAVVGRTNPVEDDDFAISMVSLDGECMLCVKDSMTDAINEQDSTKMELNVDSVICADKEGAVQNDKILVVPIHVPGKTKYGGYTHRLWSYFRNFCSKFIRGIVLHEMNNDIML